MKDRVRDREREREREKEREVERERERERDRERERGSVTARILDAHCARSLSKPNCERRTFNVFSLSVCLFFLRFQLLFHCVSPMFLLSFYNCVYLFSLSVYFFSTSIYSLFEFLLCFCFLIITVCTSFTLLSFLINFLVFLSSISLNPFLDFSVKPQFFAYKLNLSQFTNIENKNPESSELSQSVRFSFEFFFGQNK